MTAGPRFQAGQRVRLVHDPRATGKITRTPVFPDGTGIEVTMDNQFSPRPTRVRYHVPGDDFEPVPEDYLDDTEAMEHIACVVTHIPGDRAKAGEMLAEVLGVLRRNGRTGSRP